MIVYSTMEQENKQLNRKDEDGSSLKEQESNDAQELNEYFGVTE